jgi:hypothetical protein
MHKDKKKKKSVSCALKAVKTLMPHVLGETFVSLAATIQQKQIKGRLCH